MIWTIARKEFLTSLLTYRFGVGLILCLVSVTAGTLAVMEDYRSRREAYAQAVQGYEEQLKKEGTYGRLTYDLKAFREPRQLAMFSVGSDRWQGNVVTVTHHFAPEEAQWLGAANPYLSIFRSIDLALVVQFVLGLLALLFAHDAVCGEREEGTLKMVLANRVPRDQVLLGKVVGHLGVLGVILLAGFLAALIVVRETPDMGLRGEAIGRTGALLAVSGLYLTALYFAGLSISASVQRPATALVLAISAWVAGVAIYPNAVAYAVDELMPMRASVKAAEEAKMQLNQLFDEESRKLTRTKLGVEEFSNLFGLGIASSSENWIKGYVEGNFPTQEALETHFQSIKSQFEAYITSLRQQGKQAAVEALEAAARGDWETYGRLAEQGRQEGVYITEYLPSAEVDRRVNQLREFFASRERLRIEFADRVWDEGWRPVEERMKRAGSWSRWLGMLSPAGAYQDAAAILARTDRGEYWRFLEETRQYRRQLIAHFEEEGYFSSREWFNDQAKKGNLAGLPRFREIEETLWQSLERARLNLLVLAGFNLLGLLGAHWRFRRCDVR